MNSSDKKTNNDSSMPASAPRKQSIVERFKHTHLAMDDAQANKALKITGLVLISLLCLFVLVKTINEVKAYNTVGEAPMAPYSITVSGHGEVAAKRNIASVSFSSDGEGKTTSEAQSKAAEANNKALAFLRSKGIPEADISTQAYSTYPKYEQTVKPCTVTAPSNNPVLYDRSTPEAKAAMESSRAVSAVAPVAPCNNYDQVISGYTTTQTITVKIRDIDQRPNLSSEIVDGLGASGVRVGNVTNTIDDMEAIQSQARLIAIANARMEAKKIARSLGVRVTKVVSYYDNNNYPMMEDMAMSARAAAAPGKSVAPELPSGETKVTADVSVTFEIR